MFKRIFATITGAALLTSVAVTDSRAAGLDLAAQNLKAGDVLFDPIDPITVSNLGLFEASGTASTGDAVSVVQTATGGFELDVGPLVGAAKIEGGSTGTDGTDFATMENGTTDLIEILFTLTTNDASLTGETLVLASLVGDFFGTATDPITGLPLSFNALTDVGFFDTAKLTLTEVKVIPLPAGMVLLLTALGGLILVRRRNA
ncbi:MAG: VPLPA-CTERM sorting domain-containing protein [Pseudomonadota bacterium]